jgi:hypothetical protein
VRGRIVLLSLLLAGAARGEATWPPSPQAGERLAALRAVLADRASTPAAREAARAEMLRMILANPDAPPPKTMPSRAAVALPAESAAPAKKPEVARVVPILPPASRVAPPVVASPPLTVPSTGATLVPQGAGYVDPATGRLYQPVAGGFLDPATGRFVPKP